MFIPLATIYAAAEIIAPYTCNLSNNPEKIKAALLHSLLQSGIEKNPQRRAELAAQHVLIAALRHLQTNDYLPDELQVDCATLQITRVQECAINNTPAFVALVDSLADLAGVG